MDGPEGKTGEGKGGGLTPCRVAMCPDQVMTPYIVTASFGSSLLNSFKDSLNDIRQTLEGFLCDMLNHCKNRFEVDTILEIQANHRFEEASDSDGILPKMLNTWEDSVLPPGVEQAITLNFKQV